MNGALTLVTGAKSSLQRLVDASLSLGLTCGVLGALPAIVGARHWVLDTLASATLHVFVVLSLVSAVALGRRRHRSALLAACTAALLGIRMFPHLDFAEHESTPLLATWLVANVHTSNRNHDALLSLIRDRRPHVIGLVETDSVWLRALDGPLHAYSHRVLHAREDNFGIALFSRIPFTRSAVTDFGVAPSISASIAPGGREIDLVLVHVLPPISLEYAQERNEQLARIGALRPRAGKGLVIVGDFNATPYSPTFRDAFAQPPFRRAGGLTGTFPAAAPPAFRIPIDHVLAAGTVRVRRTLDREIMSDHLPLTIELYAE